MESDTLRASHVNVEWQISADPQPQDPKALMLGATNLACVDHRVACLKADAIETLVERLRVVTEGTMENIVAKHQKVLLSKMDRFMGSECNGTFSNSQHGPRLNSPGNQNCTASTRSRNSTVVGVQMDTQEAKEAKEAPMETHILPIDLEKPSVMESYDRQTSNATVNTAVARTSTSSKITVSQPTDIEREIQSVRMQYSVRSNISGFHPDQMHTSGQPKIARIVNSSQFDVLMGTAVMTNALFIGVETEVQSSGNASPDVVRAVSYFYTLVFLIELSLRLVANWREFVCKSNAMTLCWNYLDVFIVLSSLIDVALDFATSGGQVDMSNMRVIRVIRVMRLVRLVRITRLVRFVRALRLLVLSIFWSLKSVFWAMVLMAAIMYVFAILFTQAALSYRSNLDPATNSDIPGLDRFWGGLGPSMLSLLMSIAGGISWVEVAEPLSSLSTFWLYLFLLYIGFTHFVFLNVVTGVFCQSAVEGYAEDHDSRMHAFRRHKKIYATRFGELFNEIDADGSGKVNLHEFLERMEDDDVKDYFQSLDISCTDALCLFDLFDSPSGVDVDEFVMGCLRMKGSARSSDMIRIMHDNQVMEEKLNKILNALGIAGKERKTLKGLSMFVGDTLSARMTNCGK